MDTDNSGSLTVHELCDGLKKAGFSVNLTSIRQLVKAIDGDDNMLVDMDEFLYLMRLHEES